MIERAPVAERLENPELLSSAGHYAGLHPRLLIGGVALNPTKQDLTPVTSEQLGDFQQRDYSPFSNASGTERKTYWDQRNETTYETRRQAWITGCVATFESAKDFFKDTDKGKKWNELYSKLGIDTQNFTSQTAEGLHNRYFQNSKLGIKQFVADVYNAYAQGGRVNMAELEANLSAVGWLSNIFGKNSSEVVTQMVMAEAKLISNPDQIVQEANKRDSDDVSSRVNNLNSDEQRILTFLWQRPQPQPTPAKPVPEGGIKIVYERLKPDAVRRFLNEENVQQNLLNPARVAAKLREDKPQKYGHIPQDQLTREIAQEEAQLNEWRNDKGLTNKYLVELVEYTLNDYERFLKGKYGVNLPEIHGLQLAVISGKTVEMFNLPPGVLAFVQLDRNVIFMNFDVIFATAQKIANAEHRRITGQEMFRRMTPKQVKEMITRLLKEIHPHEYSHLLADLAYWKQIKLADRSEEIELAKAGLEVVKPEWNGNRWIFKVRGTPLMEAVTVELTNKWAKSFNARLDIPAYTAERKVLGSLTNILAQDQGISQDEAFKKVAKGYFTPEGFRHLVEELSGKTVTPDGISFKRPHLMQIVYALMEYETVKATQERREVNYPMAFEYVNSANNLSGASDVLKREIVNMVNISQRLGSPLSLSPRAIRYLVGQGIQSEK